MSTNEDNLSPDISRIVAASLNAKHHRTIPSNRWRQLHGMPSSFRFNRIDSLKKVCSYLLKGLVVFSSLVFWTTHTHAAAIVTECTEANLQTAMAGGGLVNFACGGTLTLTSPLAITADTILDAGTNRVILSGNGATRIFIVANEKRLTLLNITLTNGYGLRGAAIWSDGGVVSVSNCVFAGNTATATNEASGGAIANLGGRLSARRCVFSGNQCLVTGTGAEGTNGSNSSPSGSGGSGGPTSGGAIWNSGALVLDDCFFIKNQCDGGLGGMGGLGLGFYPSGPGGIGGPSAGGAVYHLDGALLVTGCTFASNSVRGGTGGTGGAQLSNFRNGAGSGGLGGTATGGGIHAESGTVLATNNTLYRNLSAGGTGGGGGKPIDPLAGRASGPGGDAFGAGLFSRNAAVVAIYHTLAGNSAIGGPGAPGLQFAANGLPGVGIGGGVASISNAIVLGSTVFADNPGGNGYGPIIDRGFNISSDASLQFTNEGGWINLDPKVLPLANNGGPTPTMALAPESPAIDHGRLTSSLDADQRGASRTFGLAADAGAYEFAYTAPLPAGDVDWLRASVTTGGLVVPASNGIFRLNTPLVFSRDTTIDGTGRSILFSGGKGTRVIQVEPGVSLKLIHVTIADGHATNGAGLYNNGGGVTLVDCLFATNRVVGLDGNNGTNAGPNAATMITGGNGGVGAAAAGGAIFNTGLIAATNCAFVGNRATGGNGGGGGMGSEARTGLEFGGRCRSYPPGGGGAGASGGHGLGGAIYNLGDIVLLGSSIEDNRATGGAGGIGASVAGSPCIIGSGPGAGGNGGNGGMGGGAAIFSRGHIEVQGCTFVRNEAIGGNGGIGGRGYPIYSPSGTHGVSGTGNGGAILNEGSGVLRNVTIANNTATGGDCADGIGGALHNAEGLELTHCTLWLNAANGGAATNDCSGVGRSIGASIFTYSGAFTSLASSIVGSPTSLSNCVGTITDRGHNICSDPSATFSSPHSLNNVDPRLGPLANNGGPTPTLTLEPNSPALDAAATTGCPSTDQRGVSRPAGNACDIGAFEGTDGFHFPILAQTFTPALILAGRPSRLHFILTNSSSRPLTEISFVNRLPASIVVAANPNLSVACAGSVDASGGMINLANISLAPNQGCSVAVDVTGFVPGTYTNLIGPICTRETEPDTTTVPAVLVVDAPPFALTEAASNRSGSGMTLHGRVNPNGFSTTAYFEFGTTTNYGTTTPIQSIGSGRSFLGVTESIGGLAPASGYHFRIVASSDLGTTLGSDQFLLTSGPGPGTAVTLDGGDDYVASPDMRNSFTNETVTIEVWFRARSAGTIVRERGNPPPTNGLWNDAQIEILPSGTVTVSIAGIPTSVDLGTATFDAWHHAVLRYVKATTNLDGFLDGAEAATDAAGDRDAPWEFGYPLYYAFGLGDWPAQPSVGFFRGDLGEVRIWNAARSADEIRTNLDRRLTGTEPGLVCYWKFDEGASTNATDASAHGNTGVFADGTSWVSSTGAPQVTTRPAGSINRVAATLNALIHSSGSDTTAYFEYGLTKNYGARTQRQLIESAERAAPLSQRIADLVGGTMYHFRAVASNAFGVVTGTDAELITLPSPPPGAVRFDGVDDFISTPNLTGVFPSTTVTIEIRFRPFGPGVLIDERGQLPPARSWQTSQLEILPTGEIKARVFGLSAISLGTASFGIWHHAVIRFDEVTGTFAGFLDGIEATTKAQGQRVVPWEVGLGMFYAFGIADSNNLGSGAFFPGEIGEVRIWNIGRTDEQIRTNLNLPLAGTEPGLVCYWRFEEGIGPTTGDLSGHGNDGSLNGGLRWVDSTKAPFADTGTVGNFTGNSAILQANVNPNGADTTGFFEWGSTTNYGARTPIRTFEGGYEEVSLEATVTNLPPNGLYHYRVVAANSFGTNQGNDGVFFTHALAAGISVGLRGANDYIFTPDLRASFSNTTMTLELWFKAIGPGVLIDERGQPFGGWQDSQLEVLPSGEVRGRVWYLTPITIGRALFGTWHHAVLRYDKQAGKLDGMLDGIASSQTSVGARSSPIDSGLALHYGFGLGDSTHLGDGSFFKGQLDEIRIWNIARTDSQIHADIVRRLIGTEPGLVCYLRLDDRTGTVALDSSGLGYHSTLVNNPAWIIDSGPIETGPAISWHSDGRVQLDYIGFPQNTYVLQASTNLTNWLSISTNQASSIGSLPFIDANGRDFLHRFYRITTP